MKSKQHLYEIDLMRTFIILGVVCVHVISFYNLFVSPDSATGVFYGAGLIAMHFTREGFMFLTGLVLFVTYYGRPLKAATFWVKRFKLIIIPYFAWTLIYILFSNTYMHGADWSLIGIAKNFFLSVVVGKQFYLYFLVISIQMYALFPLLVVFLKRFEKWHGWILLFSFSLQLWFMWFNQAFLEGYHWSHLPYLLAMLDKYRDRFILTYQFWFIGGALMAIHYQKIKDYVLANRKVVYVILTVGLIGIWSYYFVDQLLLHGNMDMTTLVLQPIMTPYSLIITLVFWNFGVKWAAIRTNPTAVRFSRFIMVVAKASFGVFLVHPLVLHFVEVAVYKMHPGLSLRLALLPVSIFIVYGISILISKWIGSVPYLGYIVGQKVTFKTTKRAPQNSSSVPSGQ